MCDWADFSSFPAPAEYLAIIRLKYINESTFAINLCVYAAFFQIYFDTFRGHVGKLQGKVGSSVDHIFCRLNLETQSIQENMQYISDNLAVTLGTWDNLKPPVTPNRIMHMQNSWLTHKIGTI